MRSRHLVVLNNAGKAGPSESAAPPENEGGFALPNLHHADLDWDGLDCVLADLDDFTTIVELQGRNATGEVAALQGIEEARDQLVDRTLIGLQIVYRFADQTWCDTLMATASGARLSRMLHEQ